MSKTEVFVTVTGLFSIVASTLLTVSLFSLVFPEKFQGVPLQDNLKYMEEEIYSQLRLNGIDVNIKEASLGLKIFLISSCLLFFLESLMMIAGVKTKKKCLLFPWVAHMFTELVLVCAILSLFCAGLFEVALLAGEDQAVYCSSV